MLPFQPTTSRDRSAALAAGSVKTRLRQKPSTKSANYVKTNKKGKISR